MRVALNLTIEREWFDKIASGEKREEYRGCDNRQCVRLYDEVLRDGIVPDDLLAVFRNGYRMDSRALAVELVGMGVRRRGGTHPEWGEPSRRHFVLDLGKVMARGTYAEVKGGVG